MAIKVSSSGIRGQFFELTPARVVRFAQAYATYMGGDDILLGSDLRPSGSVLRHATIAGLTSCGANVYDYGTTPTPILQWLLRQERFNGGITLSANHNTFDWNSLIFLNTRGAYLNQWEAEELFNIYHSARYNFQTYDRIGRHLEERENIKDYYRSFALKKPERLRKFVIDCGNGFDRDIVDWLQEALKVRLIPIFVGNTDLAMKDPEPNQKNAIFLATMVRETGSDGGFLLNSDASRLLLVDEKGDTLSEEMTFPLFAAIMLEREKRDLVTNYSTSKVIDQVAKKHGVKVFRTDVGQPYVVQMAMDIKTTIGGEGNGSTVYTPFSYGFDSLFCIGKIVEHLVEKETTISRLAEEWRPPETFKESIQLPPDKIYATMDKLETLYPKKRKLKDGFYIEESHEWMCVRASATVSIIRIVGEGKNIMSELVRIREHLP